MIKHASFFLLALGLLCNATFAQSTAEAVTKEYVSLEEALKNPENVYRLNLSNQQVSISDDVWSKFTNLQYLSLKNDHLKQIPAGIGYLKNLKVLDLSGNDFEVLPASFSNLTNLQELFLNDEKRFKFEKNIPILSTLPNLKTLHLENDGLKKLPDNITQISHLEALYLNDNRFKQVPMQLKGMKDLKYLDFHDNRLKLPKQDIQNENPGINIRF